MTYKSVQLLLKNVQLGDNLGGNMSTAGKRLTLLSKFVLGASGCQFDPAAHLTVVLHRPRTVPSDGVGLRGSGLSLRLS